MKKLLGIVVLGFLWCNVSFADDGVNSTRFMLKHCKEAMSGKEDKVMESVLICKMYFRGAWEGALIRQAHFDAEMERMNVTVNKDSFRILNACVPNKTTLNQFINIFINHMDRNPEKLDEMLMLNISDALDELFPCKN